MARDDREYKDFEDGRYVFREHEYGDQAFIVVSGTVEIVRAVGDKLQVLATLERGEIFGEMALIDDHPRMASAKAVGPTRLIIVSRDTFESKLRETDAFVRALLKIFTDTLRDLGKTKTEREEKDRLAAQAARRAAVAKEAEAEADG